MISCNSSWLLAGLVILPFAICIGCNQSGCGRREPSFNPSRCFKSHGIVRHQQRRQNQRRGVGQSPRFEGGVDGHGNRQRTRALRPIKSSHGSRNGRNRDRSDVVKLHESSATASRWKARPSSSFPKNSWPMHLTRNRHGTTNQTGMAMITVPTNPGPNDPPGFRREFIASKSPRTARLSPPSTTPPPTWARKFRSTISICKWASSSI